jgi:hypothetical protein
MQISTLSFSDRATLRTEVALALSKADCFECLVFSSETSDSPSVDFYLDAAEVAIAAVDSFFQAKKGSRLGVVQPLTKTEQLAHLSELFDDADPEEEALCFPRAADCD